MGCSKNYIMYWGGYVYYNSIGMKKSVHKDAIFSRPFMSNIDKGGGFFTFLPLPMLFFFICSPKNPGRPYYCAGVNSASNSVWLIFSFSISKSAQAWRT